MATVCPRFPTLYGEVSIGEILRWDRLIAFHSVPLLFDFKIAKHRHEHNEHYEAHAAANDETEASRQNGGHIDAVLHAIPATDHFRSFQSAHLRALGCQRVLQQWQHRLAEYLDAVLALCVVLGTMCCQTRFGCLAASRRPIA